MNKVIVCWEWKCWSQPNSSVWKILRQVVLACPDQTEQHYVPGDCSLVIIFSDLIYFCPVLLVDIWISFACCNCFQFQHRNWNSSLSVSVVTRRNSILVTFREWIWQIVMRSYASWVCFPHSHAVSRVTISSVCLRLPLIHPYCFCALWNETPCQSFSVFSIVCKTLPCSVLF